MSSSIATRIRWTARSLLIRSGIPAARDRAVFARAFAPSATSGAHVLLVAPGGGNVGDQALFEAFLEGTTGEVVVVVRREGDVELPAEHASRVVITPLPELVYGVGGAHRKDVAALASLLSDASSFSVIGADVMDGRYVLRASVSRSVLAGAAARAGVPTRILGFSWNAAAKPAARRALVAASRSGALPLLRDPVSLRRAERDGVVGAQLVSDIVFSAETVDRSWAERYETDLPLAIVNVSGLIANDVDQTAEYVEVIDHLLGMGRAVLLLPHVSRPGADDVIPCGVVYEKVREKGPVTLAPALPTPAQVRGLTEIADVVVTGRMHLAVMSLANRTPAVTLATQGKVEGLMELMATPDLCVEPRAGFGAVVTSRLDAIVPADSQVRQEIEKSLPRVKALAAGNTARLEPTEARFALPVTQR